jgi:hypothetical protein
MLCSTTHNSDLHAPADIGLDTGRLQKEAGEREKKKPHQCPNMTTNRGHQHILHQLTTCTGVQVLHWHLSHIRKNSVSNWNYCWAIYSLACRIPEEFGRDLWRTLLLCNKFVLSKEKERMALVLRTELLTDEVQDQVHLPYVDCTFL